MSIEMATNLQIVQNHRSKNEKGQSVRENPHFLPLKIIFAPSDSGKLRLIFSLSLIISKSTEI